MYDLPPIAKGAYEIGPNDKFLIYCSNIGYVYAAIAGRPTYKNLENIRPKMDIFHQDETPSFSISFLTGENQYWVTIYERVNSISVDIKIPLDVSR